MYKYGTCRKEPGRAKLALASYNDCMGLSKWGIKNKPSFSGMIDKLAVKMSDRDDNRDDDDDGRTGLITKTRPKTKKPSLYKVLLLNDDYTPMEFVIYVLEKFFNKGHEDAQRIMLHVHQKGVGVCGIYTYEVAETKVTQVIDFARQHSHPLQCTMEKE